MKKGFLDVMNLVVKKYKLHDDMIKSVDGSLIEYTDALIDNLDYSEADYGEDFVNEQGDPLRGYVSLDTLPIKSPIEHKTYAFERKTPEFMMEFMSKRRAIEVREYVKTFEMACSFMDMDFDDKVKVLTEHIGFDKGNYRIADSNGVSRHFFSYQFGFEFAQLEMYIMDDEDASVAKIFRYQNAFGEETEIPIDVFGVNYAFYQVYGDLNRLNMNPDMRKVDDINLIFKFRSYYTNCYNRSNMPDYTVDSMPVFGQYNDTLDDFWT